MRNVAGKLIMICGIALAGLRVAIPYPEGFLSQVLLEQNVHALVERVVMRTITSLSPAVCPLFVSNLVEVSHMVAIWCQAVLILLVSYLLSRLVKA